MELLSTILVFIVVICILVVVHEFGHFIAARLSGMRVDVFAIGMGKRLFGFNKINGFTFGDLPENWDYQGHTDYRLAILPIGGYVKIVGMVDESMDDEILNTEPQPYEFRSKNAFQKAITISAGVIMNTLLAIMIFTSLAYFQGKTIINTTTIAYVEKGSAAEKFGLQSGDKVISINGKTPQSFNDVMLWLAGKNLGANKSVVVERAGNQIQIEANGKEILDALSNQKALGISPDGAQVVLNFVESLKPAGQLGLQTGDTILALNSQKVASVTQFVDIVKENAGKEISVDWKRNFTQMSGKVLPDGNGKIGVGIEQIFAGTLYNQSYGLLPSIGIGFDETWGSFSSLYQSIAQIFKGKLSFKQSFGGPVMIAKAAYKQAQRGFGDWLAFIATLSVSLAFINILPFPALDGGHLVFIIIEGIIRKELPVKAKMIFQQAGMVVLLLLMAFVLYNDITR